MVIVWPPDKSDHDVSKQLCSEILILGLRKMILFDGTPRTANPR